MSLATVLDYHFLSFFYFTYFLNSFKNLQNPCISKVYLPLPSVKKRGDIYSVTRGRLSYSQSVDLWFKILFDFIKIVSFITNINVIITNVSSAHLTYKLQAIM
jgi:hypothetical protein